MRSYSEGLVMLLHRYDIMVKQELAGFVFLARGSHTSEMNYNVRNAF